MVYVVTRRVIVVFHYELTKGGCNFFQHIFQNQKKSEFTTQISRLRYSL